MEINKGRKNKFCTFLRENGGHTYQFTFQSKKINSLPKKIKIKTKTNEFIELSYFENFDNKLKKRITIINAIKQDFINNNNNYLFYKFNYDESEFIDFEEYKNLKLYII